MTSSASHGDLGVVSASVLSGEAPVRLIRYDADPAAGGWVVLAAEETRDLPHPPPIENVQTMCLHCLMENFDPEIRAGVEIARAEAHEGGGCVGIAVWERDEWLTGDPALDALR